MIRLFHTFNKEIKFWILLPLITFSYISLVLVWFLFYLLRLFFGITVYCTVNKFIQNLITQHDYANQLR